MDDKIGLQLEEHYLDERRKTLALFVKREQMIRMLRMCGYSDVPDDARVTTGSINGLDFVKVVWIDEWSSGSIPQSPKGEG